MFLISTSGISNLRFDAPDSRYICRYCIPVLPPQPPAPHSNEPRLSVSPRHFSYWLIPTAKRCDKIDPTLATRLHLSHVSDRQRDPRSGRLYYHNDTPKEGREDKMNSRS